MWARGSVPLRAEFSADRLRCASRNVCEMKSPGSSGAVDPVASAKEAGLRYVTDSKPGIHRKKRNGDFIYIAPDGKRIGDHNELVRIKRLAIPPAWTDVWICPSENGHLQVTGRDARGRKQYRYHPDWRKVRDETKYDRMIAFGKALPEMRRRVARDLRKPGLPREKVLAAIVRLLETTLVRVGNEEYARDNKSYGLTTMRDKHARISREKVTFEFRGKSGRNHEIDVLDPRLAGIVKRCRDLPGYELFQYLDEHGNVVDITSSDVNDYLRQITGEDFTAKDFRTWAGTVLAARALQEFERFENSKEAKQNITTAVEAVARMLGNTPAICRRCYVHPVIFDTYLDGSLVERLRRRVEKKLTRSLNQLRPEEAAVMGLLQQTLAHDVKRPAAN
jgi:DNA topoisomerase I